MAARTRTTRRRALGLLAAGSLAGAVPRVRRAVAQDRNEVDLNLALAVDASGCVNHVRFELQKRGYVDAFNDPRVLSAIKTGPRAAIGVMMYQWTGPRQQTPVVPWVLIDDERSLREFAGRVARSQRDLYGGGTSISGAIEFGTQILAQTPFSGGRKVMDISGDGANNGGRPVNLARDEAIDLGININGLPILEVEPDLEDHYRNNVIGGPGAFAVAAATFQDFGTAIIRKLIMEIAHRPDEVPRRRQG
jgi:hypothetical protein